MNVYEFLYKYRNEKKITKLLNFIYCYNIDYINLDIKDNIEVEEYINNTGDILLKCFIEKYGFCYRNGIIFFVEEEDVIDSICHEIGHHILYFNKHIENEWLKNNFNLESKVDYFYIDMNEKLRKQEMFAETIRYLICGYCNTYDNKDMSSDRIDFLKTLLIKRNWFNRLFFRYKCVKYMVKGKILKKNGHKKLVS